MLPLDLLEEDTFIPSFATLVLDPASRKDTKHLNVSCLSSVPISQWVVPVQYPLPTPLSILHIH